MGGGRTHGSRSRTAKAKKALAGANANDKKKAITKGLKVPYRPPEKTAHKKDMMIQWRFPSVVMSVRDKNPWLDLSKDHLEISGTHGGFKTARASHGVRHLSTPSLYSPLDYYPIGIILTISSISSSSPLNHTR